jgi:C4-dicarboxylate transporter DctM subunit
VRYFFATRAMNGKELIDTVLETTRLLATLLPLLCIAGSLNTILDHSGAPKQMVEYMVSAVDNRWMLMFMINILLLIVWAA